MQIKKIVIFPLICLLFACSGAHEAIMPFKNAVYSGERLFPIKKSDAKKSFRIWINNATSIDRILTISQDSLYGNEANLIEIGKRFKKKKSIEFYNEIKIVPKSGFEIFFKKLDSLNIMTENDRENFSVALHEPFSLYIVEYKNGKQYNQFRFNTVFPMESNKTTNYEKIENLIFQEFAFSFYMK